MRKRKKPRKTPRIRNGLVKKSFEGGVQLVNDLERVAKQNGRSFSSEVAMRLQESLVENPAA